jgi:site-specific DNA-cytosine methylase
MKVLIACEESQTVCKAFRAKGHEAYSCDLLPTSGKFPEWHIQGDAIVEAYSGKYDIMIAHPPCTDIAVSGARHFKEKIADGRQQRALDFVEKLMKAPIEKICIENPVSVISSKIRKPDQIIQPYHFGHEAQKTTCLWLKNLPQLKHTKVVGRGEFITFPSGKKHPAWYSKLSGKGGERSKTFQGIADAMAEQWG